MSTHVLVVDDDAMVCRFVRETLEADGRIVVDAVAHDGADAVESAMRYRPDVVLMDLRMPGLSGVDATREIRSLPEPPTVLALTTVDLDDQVLTALSAGAAGYVLKTTPPDGLRQLVVTAAQGTSVLSPDVLSALVNHSTPATGRPSPDVRLSDRERQILSLLARGHTNAEISADLYLSVATVKSHLTRLMTRLGMTNRTQLALWAQRHSPL